MISGFAPKSLSIKTAEMSEGHCLVESPFPLNEFNCSAPYLRNSSSNDIISAQNKSSINSLSVEVEDEGIRNYKGEFYIFRRKRWHKIVK